MNIKKILYSLGLGGLILASSGVMAVDFPTLPGYGGYTGGTTGSGTSGSSQNIVIFSCINAAIGQSLSGNTSCNSNGSTSSSCSSSTVGSAVSNWEMTSSNSTLEAALANAESCAEAVKAAGNCSPSGGGTKTIYTCQY